MSPLGLVLVIVLVLLVVGGLPQWPYARAGWGYGPSGLLGVILIIVVVLLLLGRL